MNISIKLKEGRTVRWGTISSGMIYQPTGSEGLIIEKNNVGRITFNESEARDLLSMLSIVLRKENNG